MVIVPKEDGGDDESLFQVQGSHTAFESAPLWTKRTIPAEALREATLGLDALPAWSKQVERWGTEDGDRLDVVKGPQGIDEIRVRFDVRDIDVRFLERVAAFAARIDCVFVSCKGLVVPLVSELEVAIRASPAARTCDQLDGLEGERAHGPD